MIVNSFFNIIREGGPVFMIPLLLLSVLSLSVIMERIFFLAKRSVVNADTHDTVRKAAREMKGYAIVSLVEHDKSLAACIIHDAMNSFQAGKGALSLEEAITESADNQRDALTSHMWILRAVGHIAPLLGLMGTVVGLAIAFRNIAETGLSQQSVAGGISIALITTIAGLTIALLTLFADYCLRAWAEMRFKTIRRMLCDLVNWYGSK
jgi:biopolymer transport protein ExbB